MAPSPFADDRALARRVLAGERAAFEEFFGAQVHRLYGFARARLDDAEATREVVQSTICEALACLGSYRGEGSLSAWLFGICRFEISAHYRRRQRIGRQTELLEDAPEILDLLDERPGSLQRPDLALRHREIAARVHETLDRLPPSYAAVLEWKYLDGLSMKEIAVRSDTTPKAVESLLTRARGAFRSAFRGNPEE